MCGIAGCLALALEADPDQSWVATATQRISHRGPDDEGFYHDPDVALGYKRLAIIDLSPGGHQPMVSADGRYWMVYNGEIYNYVELGAELREQGVVLKSSSDSEVLLETYARVGKDIVHRLRGMYAFAIWDTWTRELFCARDPFGIKPFYYRIDQGPAMAVPEAGPAQQAGQRAPRHAAQQPGTARQQPGASGQRQAPAEPVDWFAPAPKPSGPASSQPDYGDSSFGGSGYSDSGYSDSGYSDSGYSDSGSGGGYDSHTYGASGYGDPAPGALDYGVPGYPPAGHADSGYGPSAVGNGAPHHGAPGHSLPDYGTAGYGEPGYGTSGYGGTGYGSRDPQPPDYGVPGYPARGHQTSAPAGGYPGAGYGGPGYPSGAAVPPADAVPAPSPASRPGGPVTADMLLRFASERKSLAEPGELRTLDRDALRRYLSFQYVPPPDTMAPPVRVLPPGHAMIARPGAAVDVYRYWRPSLRPARVSSENSAQAILDVMRDSIAVHLRSDAPLGAFLSGGIDSAAICALAAEHRPDLLTFTVGFEREGYSEIDRAQETAAALGVKSNPYVITPEEFFRHLPQIVWHLDDPMADAAAVPLWFVAREAARQVKVVLSGEGSDELFGGYAIYHQPGVVRAGERLPEWGRTPIKRAAALIPAGVKGKGLLERTSTPLRRRYIGNAHVYADELVDLIAGPGQAGPYDVTDPIYDQAEELELDDVSTMQLVDINTWLAGDILVKADRMTMAHSLELRVPFLDREVMAVAARLAREEKVGAGTTKTALRAAMSEVLPPAAAQRAKLGFPVPIGHWLKSDAHGWAEHLLREAQTDEWINRQAALDLLVRFRSGDPTVTWRHLWVLIVFSLWHRIFVERAYDPAALGWEPPPGAAW